MLSPFRKLPKLLLLLTCLSAAGCFSVWLGQDANWDLQNYHLYNAFSFLHGRAEQDFAPVGMQSWFNPLADVPYFVLATGILSEQPQVLSFVMGLPGGIVAFLVVVIVASLRKDLEEITVLSVVLCVLTGVTGFAVVTQLGATFNEVPLAVFVLFGLWLATRQIGTDDQVTQWRMVPILIAGGSVGVAAGLKLTAAAFAPGMVIAMLVVGRFRAVAWRQATAFSTAWLVAFALSFGWWAFRIYELVGNPVLPQYNQIFKSPWYPLHTPDWYNQVGLKGLLDLFFFPFSLLRMAPQHGAEIPFADWRFAGGLVGGVLVGVGYVFYRLRQKVLGTTMAIETIDQEFLPKPLIFLLIFSAVSYVVWATLFYAVLRYAIPLEVLTGFLVACGAIAFGRLMLWSLRAKRLLIVTVLLVWSGTLALTTQYSNWGRVEYGDRVFDVSVPRLPANSLVLVVSSPLGYVLPFVGGRDLSFVGITHITQEAEGYELWRETEHRIASREGPLYVLLNSSSAAMDGVLAKLGVTIKKDKCRAVKTNISSDIPRLCRASAPRASQSEKRASDT